jgi:excisionase family DNA binding protein
MSATRSSGDGRAMRTPPDPLAVLDAIPRELLPAALARLTARVLEPPPAQPPPVQERLLTPDEAAAILGVHRRWIYKNADLLGAQKLSRRKLRIHEASLREYLRRGSR